MSLKLSPFRFICHRPHRFLNSKGSEFF
jgi:hypothetical protein